MTRWPWILLNPIPEQYRYAIMYCLLFTLLSITSWQLAAATYVLSANWLTTSIAVVLFLRSPIARARSITLSYIVSISLVSLWFGPHIWSGVGAIISSVLVFSIMGWLFLKYRPLNEKSVDKNFLLRLIVGYFVVATPIGVAAGSLFLWYYNGSYDVHSLLLTWLYSSLCFLLLLIPCLKFSRHHLYTLTLKEGGLIIGLILVSCILCLVLAQLFSNPFIFIAMFLALIALYSSVFIVSLWTIGTLVLTWLILAMQWIPQPEFIMTMSPPEVWTSSVATAFFLQLISLLTELMNKNALRLQQSEARMRGALEFAATGFALTSQQGEILEANVCLCRMLGYSREELKGLTAFEISHPDDKQRSRINLEAIQRGDIDHYEFEKRYLCKDGHAIWVNVRLSLLNYSPSQPKELILQVDDITHHKQAESELKHKEKRLKLALAAANAGAWEWDLAGIHTWWAEEIYRILRLTPEEIEASQENWLALIHPEDRARVQVCIQHAITHASGYCVTYRIIRQDGSTAWIEDYADIELDASGQLYRVYGISQDVTERTLIELAVQHSESRLRAILNCAVDAIITMDSQGRIHSFNPAAEKMFGYSASEALGENITLIIPSPHKERHQSYLERYLKTGVPHIIGQGREMMAQQKNGHLIPIELTITEVENQGDRFFTGMLRDISAHKQAEAALIAARSELQGVINAASEIAIIVTTQDGIITMFNIGAERMLGYSADEIVGTRTPILFHDMNEIVSRSIEITRETGIPIAGFATIVTEAVQHGFESREWSYIRKDGSRLTVLLTVTQIRAADNTLTGFLGIAKDITPLKITQAELYRAKNQAEQANKAKSEFLANMSHEIRTPLNAILGTAFLLESSTLDSSQRQYVKMISGAGRSLLLILNDILDFSKIEAGRMDISPVEFSLNEILDSLASIMSVNAADKSLDLLISVQPDVPTTLIGDGMRLQQILINLTGNAIKFTHQGSVSLNISLLQRGTDAVTLRFSITDTGIGMSPQQQERLLAPFTQADNSMTRKYGGTGLGLAISKRLVELMDGSLGVHSQAGSGSEFWFSLPFALGSQSSATRANPHPMQSLRVLILDCNPVVMESLTLVVQALGWQATPAASAADAQLMLDEQPYDICLGCWPLSDALPLLTSIERWPQTLFIAVSRLQQKESLSLDTQAAKLAATLVQPVTSSNLYNAVLEAHSRSAGSVERLFQPVASTATPAQPFTGLRMLLVEDNEINQLVACRILEQAGARVDVASNGQEAVVRLRQANPYAIILMDVQMPVMDGYTTTWILRQELGISTPILAMTAGVMQSEQDECRRCGMNDIIAKPLDVQQMFACIQRHLPIGSQDSGTLAQAHRAALPTLDLAELRQALGDDDPLIARLLIQFQQETRQLHTQLDQYLADHDQAAAARLVHTLKGQAGTFGAPRLAKLSRQIELAIREERSAEQATLLPELFASLDELHHAITLWLARHEDPGSKGSALSDQEFQAKMRQLESLLHAQNLAALDLFADLRVSLLQRSSLSAINSLIAAMEVLDFKLASQLLRQIAPYST